MIDDYIKKILTANVYDVAEITPLELAPNLTKRIENRVYLKREDMQPVFSFKLRGAYNKMSHLSPDALAKGVIAASAGNHAQGVALAARRLGARATIVMPCTTPTIKVNAVAQLGARVILQGDNYDQAYAHAMRLVSERGYSFIHPYDDPDVIAGQGTVGMEMLQQHSGAIDAVFVPVGGGGLIAGISLYIKYLHPDIKIIGVEPVDTPSMYEALEAGRRIRLSRVGLFADGVAVSQVGKETFRLAQQCVDEVVLVTTDEICAAVRDIYEDTRSIAEPAGALALAGLKRYAADNSLQDAALIAVVSGANMNFDQLRYVAERTELGERREALFAVTIKERPGSFRKFCRDIGRRDITEFNYRYSDPKAAHVFAGVRLHKGDDERHLLVRRLRDKGYEVTDLTDNELAKLHVRFLVGGRAPELQNEVVYRFEFPQQPGALLQFLQGIGQRWNITMFHYRNHVADYGRVLMGLQVPPAEREACRASLDALGLDYHDESSNPAYGYFLGGGG